MPVWQLDKRLIFPDPTMADPDGLLAIGGDLSEERLILAYSSGIFPWFMHDNEPFWFSPDPRCILRFEKLRISKSMQQLFKKEQFQVTVDADFNAVIRACASIPRKHETDTWIDENFIAAFQHMHDKGVAHSVEVWQNDALVGGLYGMAIGACFFGESMFSRVSNASKYGFIRFMQYLHEAGFAFCDCQVFNPHLASLGAENISRKLFLQMLEQGLQQDPINGVTKMKLT